MDGRITVLHVESDPDTRSRTASVLDGEQFTIVSASTVADAREVLANTRVECIVAASELPDGTGLELLDEVHEQDPPIPSILYGGGETVARDAISAGVTHYLREEPGQDQYALLATRIEKAVETARADREQRGHLEAIETAREGISILDEDGYYTYVNDAYAELYGYTPGEMIGQHWEMVYLDEDIEEIHEEILPQVKQEGSWEGETIGLRADGSAFVEHHRLSRTADGGLVCTIQDITERKEQSRRLETLIDNLPGIVYRCRNERGWPFDEVYGDVEAITGYTAAALEANDVSWGEEILHPEDQAEAWEIVQDAMDANEPFEVTYRLITAENTTRWAWERGRPVTVPNTEETVLEGFITDITARKERERELELRTKAINEAPVGIVMTDPSQEDNPITYANDEFVQMTGYERDEFIGHNCRFLQGPETEQEPVERMRTAIDAQEPVTVELRNYRRDGSLFWNRVSIAPVYDEEGELSNYIGFQSDITDRKKRQQQLQVIDRVLRHNVRNDMSVIQSHAELMTGEATVDHAARIMAKSNELIALAEKERVVTELLAERSQIREIALRPVLEEHVAIARDEYPDGTLTMECPAGVTISASTRFGLAIKELIQNALTHNDTATPTVSVTVTDADETVQLTVADNGPAIPEMERAALLGQSYEEPLYHGSGLGLWLVNLLVTRSEGTISYEERDSRGNEITLSLPKPDPE